MINLDGVCKIYNQGGQANELYAVRDVSLTLPLEATIVLKGPSGSGKTSLLSMIGCLSRPSQGAYLSRRGGNSVRSARAFYDRYSARKIWFHFSAV